MRETADEWIRPLGIRLKKDKTEQGGSIVDASKSDPAATQDLLPPKADLDELVAFYTNHLEHIYRVVHVPTFQLEYAHYWEQENSRSLSMSMLLLAMCSLSTSTYGAPCHPGSLTMRYRHMHKKWLAWCDTWLVQAGRKRRTLVHHQVACIVYLSKRVNMIEKKSWWKLTASLVQDAVMDGLQYDQSSSENLLVRETRRRLWTTIRELDLQNAFEFCLPSLLFTIDSDLNGIANIDDAAFDRSSKQLPPSEHSDLYTSSSYLYHSSRTWDLRLEIARRLCGSQTSQNISYNDVLYYTSLIMQAINDLPTCETKDRMAQSDNKNLLHTLLLGALQQPLLALHRPYLSGDGGQSSLSQTICYNMARDFLLSKQRLKDSVFINPTVLRADVMLPALTLSRIELLRSESQSQPYWL